MGWCCRGSCIGFRNCSRYSPAARSITCLSRLKHWTINGNANIWPRTKDSPQRPSEIFHRQCYVTTWKEQVGLRNRNYVGVDRILWESEFPRSTSTYPESTRMIESNFAEVPVKDRELILWRNAARLYKLSI